MRQPGRAPAFDALRASIGNNMQTLLLLISCYFWRWSRSHGHPSPMTVAKPGPRQHVHAPQRALIAHFSLADPGIPRVAGWHFIMNQAGRVGGREVTLSFEMPQCRWLRSVYRR